jgi:hypothetical protein
MSNSYLPRAQVHEWSEAMGKNPVEHHVALLRLLKDQRRLTRFVEENRESLKPVTAEATTYLVGVVLRMFDLAGAVHWPRDQDTGLLRGRWPTARHAHRLVEVQRVRPRSRAGLAPT